MKHIFAFSQHFAEDVINLVSLDQQISGEIEDTGFEGMDALAKFIETGIFYFFIIFLHFLLFQSAIKM